MSDKMTIDADVMRNICSNLSSMIELLDPGAPVDEVSEEPPEDLQGPSVLDRGSKEIETRLCRLNKPDLRIVTTPATVYEPSVCYAPLKRVDLAPNALRCW